MKEPIVVREGIIGCVEINGVWLPETIQLSESLRLCAEANGLDAHALHESVFIRLTHIRPGELERMNIGETDYFNVDSTRYTVTRLSKNFFKGYMENLLCLYVQDEEVQENHNSSYYDEVLRSLQNHTVQEQDEEPEEEQILLYN